MRLGAGKARKAIRPNARHVSLLTGRLADGAGRAMTPSHAQKEGKRYRYCVTRPDLVGDTPSWRVSAEKLEEQVCVRLAGLFADHPQLCDIAANASAHAIQQMLRKAEAARTTLRSGTPQERLALIAALVEQVALGEGQLTVFVRRASLKRHLGVSTDLADRTRTDLHLAMPFTRERSARGLRMVVPVAETAPPPVRKGDPNLVGLLAEAWSVRGAVLDDPDTALSELAASLGNSDCDAT